MSGSQLSLLLQTVTWQPLSNAPPPSKLKQLVREGIPISCRPSLWYQLSGGAALKRTEPAEYYTSFASLGKVSSSGGPELSLDLFRTFSNHLVLSSYKALEAVRRIVTAFGKRNQSVAYSQNINFVVAFLLVVMGTAKEEEVFWTLSALLERRLPASSVVEVGTFCHLLNCTVGVLLLSTAISYSSTSSLVRMCPAYQACRVDRRVQSGALSCSSRYRYANTS